MIRREVCDRQRARVIRMQDDDEKPTREELDAIATHLGLALPAEYMDGAVAAHRLLHRSLEELRRTQLPYLDFDEPEDALRWIERGGRSKTE
jgi:hypothetical protein